MRSRRRSGSAGSRLSSPISTRTCRRGEVDRPALLKAFRAYLEANDLDADWESVSRADNATLVNALSMMAPYGPAEKQALLEAPDLKTRAETLIAHHRNGAGARQRRFRIEPAVGDDDGMSEVQRASGIDVKMLELLACPLTKGPLVWDAERSELVSRVAKLAYPVRDGIPILLPSEARTHRSGRAIVVRAERPEAEAGHWKFRPFGITFSGLDEQFDSSAAGAPAAPPAPSSRLVHARVLDLVGTGEDVDRLRLLREFREPWRQVLHPFRDDVDDARLAIAACR